VVACHCEEELGVPQDTPASAIAELKESANLNPKDVSPVQESKQVAEKKSASEN
jgi:hypothetical protein